jgi:glutathione S-transferase
MAIDFYCGSGSPYAWRVWLALEHKTLPYKMHMMSFSGGDLRTPAFSAINPRQKVPAIVDNGFAMYESAAIVEYLEDAYPASGQPLLPRDVLGRAQERRMIREADEYLAHALEALVTEALFKPTDQVDAAAIAAAREAFVGELARFSSYLEGDYFVGAVGAMDFTLYPQIALALRIETKKKPDLGIRSAIDKKLAAWMRRVEALPYFARTIPPHWKEG